MGVFGREVSWRLAARSSSRLERWKGADARYDVPGQKFPDMVRGDR